MALLLFLIIFLRVFSSFVAGQFSDERMCLLEFKKSVSDPFGILSSWNAASFNHCSWFGVSCNENFRVSGIRIGGNFSASPSCFFESELGFHGFGMERNCSDSNGGLRGRLSDVLANLTEIRVLSLPFNGFGGEIPGKFWGLKNLEILDLEGNRFGGDFSGYHFSSLRKLRVLNLGFNGIYGRFPNSLSKCRGLRVLNMAENNISGVIPRFVGRYRKLRVLNLSFNRLVGNVPGDLGHGCGNLRHLDLSGNFLKGKIPPSLGKCSHLKTLLLSLNGLSGVIPNELGNLRRIEILDVSRNILGGLISARLGRCTHLSVFVLTNHFNALPGKEYPLGKATRGYSCSASKDHECNSFEGSIPNEITALPKLKIIWAPGANLGGEFPSNWSSCRTLLMVNLAQNSFTGDISNHLSKCSHLQFLSLSSNMLSGRLDGNLHVPCMSIFDISDNLLSGPLPKFSTNACHNQTPFNPTSAYLRFFTGMVLSEYALPFSTTRHLVVHDFSRNRFIGALPALPIVSPERCTKKFGYVFLAGGNNLSGSLGESLFEHCSAADVIAFNLSRNGISGSVPKSMGAQKALTVLDLSWNNLSGELPDDLMNMQNLEVLLLNENHLSGKRPSSSSLANMTSLHLCNLSGNDFYAMQVMDKETNVCSLDSIIQFTPQHNSTPPKGQAPSESGQDSITELSSSVMAAIFGGTAIAVALLIVLVAFCCKKNLKRPDSSMEMIPLTNSKKIIVFNDIGVNLTFERIVSATDNFSRMNCIGRGGFGSTYRAEVAPGTYVAVKRLTSERNKGAQQQFRAEINTLGRISHPHLITLIGYHCSKAEMFLIYNYLPGGNLEKFILDRESRFFDWSIVHKIALHIASALCFLHDRCNPLILHRDIKPSNILLDSEYNAYLSDFGLCKLLPPSQTHANTCVAGTYGYIAPEYALSGQVSNKADVYSYGIVLLELISDKKVLDPSFSSREHGYNIVSWAVMLLRQGTPDQVFTSKLLDTGPRDKLVKLLHVAVLCTLNSVASRPTMRQVMHRLRQLGPRIG